MLSLQDFQTILASTFFAGNETIAGIVMFIAVLAIVFTIFEDKSLVLIISMPITLVFSLMGVLDTDITILLIIVAVLGLAVVARDSWRST